jgi:hypothetical protein
MIVEGAGIMTMLKIVEVLTKEMSKDKFLALSHQKTILRVNIIECKKIARTPSLSFTQTFNNYTQTTTPLKIITKRTLAEVNHLVCQV